MGPDDFLKYFTSITEERKKPHEQYRVSFLLKHMAIGDTGYCSFDLPQTQDPGRHALRHVMMCTTALGICIGFSPR